MQIEKLKKEHLVECATAFVKRYQEIRDHVPLLPEEYLSITPVLLLLDEIQSQDLGFVATDKGEIVGYMAAFPVTPSCKGSLPGVFTPEWGHFAKKEQELPLYYELYKRSCGLFRELGLVTHMITHFAHHVSLQNLLYELAFGRFVIDGIRSVEPLTVPSIPSGFVFREAQVEDFPALGTLSEHLVRHLRSDPIGLFIPPAKPNFEESFGSKVVTFVASYAGEIVSVLRALFDDGGGCDIVKGKGTLGINQAYTKDAFRQRGIATHLLQALLHFARSHTIQRVSVDWESANFSGSGFWLRYFSPVCYSVIRRLDDR